DTRRRALGRRIDARAPIVGEEVIAEAAREVPPQGAPVLRRDEPDLVVVPEREIALHAEIRSGKRLPPGPQVEGGERERCAQPEGREGGQRAEDETLQGVKVTVSVTSAITSPGPMMPSSSDPGTTSATKITYVPAGAVAGHVKLKKLLTAVKPGG